MVIFMALLRLPENGICTQIVGIYLAALVIADRIYNQLNDVYLDVFENILGISSAT
jgi:hypothetical protein